ncbi:hypothetical protein BH23CHL5_BH23CHL5_09500 [soil metagenome]
MISLAVAAATAATAWAIGVNQGSAIIAGALGGILASVVMQRRAMREATGDVFSTEPEDLKAASETAAETILQLQAQATEIADDGARELSMSLGAQLTRILTLSQNANREAALPLVLDQLIEPAQALMTDYLFLQKRGGTAATDAMTKIASRDLPAAEYAARQVLAEFNRSGDVDLTAIRRAVDFSFSFGGEVVSPSSEMWGNRQ